MRLFRRIKEFTLAKREVNSCEIMVAVPDIKDYLVKEYERVNNLKALNESLQQQLDKAKETEIKYDAAMVTLDEYSKRLNQAEVEIDNWKIRSQNISQELKKANDTINSYKIRLNDAALTKKEIKAEIVEEVKAGLISLLSNQKGNLSKKSVCEIISTYQKE